MNKVIEMFGKKCKKGFIFSSDAAMGIAVLLLLTPLILIEHKTVEKSTDAYKSIDSITSDATIVGFYLNKNSADFSLQNNLDSTKNFAKCGKSFTLDPANGSGQANPVEKKFCDSK